MSRVESVRISDAAIAQSCEAKLKSFNELLDLLANTPHVPVRRRH